MKSTILITAAAVTAPIPAAECTSPLAARVSSCSNDFVNSGCSPVVMLFARGSTEAGNIGTVCGPQTGQGLKNRFGSTAVAVQGIEYLATLATNLLPGGADPAGIAEMKLVSLVTTECPDIKILVSGYSQCAALTHRAVESLPPDQRNRIVAAFLYSDT